MSKFKYENIIRNLQTMNGFTQEYLAKRIHVDSSTISTYELEKRVPPLTTFYKICEVCNADITFKIDKQAYSTKK
ncbi:helix-turn-helix transcriptional regulator [uncultured Parvimonas sp.]|uniref:helix-turn-helix transcriptional regulator n=1 Tax=uncultured Parvimonas sp. TaxID=747372 RepID=UPI0035A70B8B